MKKKLLACIVGFSITAVAGVTLAACAPDDGESTSSYLSIYSLYVADATDRGETVLSYDDWLLSVTGPQGDKGETGDKGDKGDTGETGTPGGIGDPGAAGKSAYEVWKDLGNTGTETDFVNWLKGATGDEGDVGETGDTGVGIDSIDVKLVNLSDTVFYHFIITLTDGEVINRFENPAEPETDIDAMNKNTAGYLRVIEEGGIEPLITFNVRYKGSLEYQSVAFDQINILDGEIDYTKVGEYKLLYEYEGYYGEETFTVYDPNDDSIKSVGLSTSVLWFTNLSVEENLVNVNLNVSLNNLRSQTVKVTPEMLSQESKVDESKGAKYYDVTYEGFTNRLYFTEVSNSTKLDYIENQTSALKGIVEGGYNCQVLVGEDPFEKQVWFLDVYAAGFTSGYRLSIPLTMSMLVKASGDDAFSNTVPTEESSEEYTVSLNNVYFEYSAPRLNIGVFELDGAKVDRIYLDDNNMFCHSTENNAFPEMYINVIYDNDYYDRHILLQEEWVVNRADIDFSVLGFKTLKVSYDGSVFNCNIEVYNPEINNIRFLHIGNSATWITVGEEFNIRAWLHTLAISVQEYVGDDHLIDIPLSKCTYDISNVDTNKVGCYPIMVTYDYHGTILKSWAYVVVDPNMEGAEITKSYTFVGTAAESVAESLVLCDNGYCALGRYDENNFIPSMTTEYKMISDNVLSLRHFDCNYVFRIIDGDKLSLLEPTGEANEVYESYIVYAGTTVTIYVYDDYYTIYALYDRMVLVHMFTSLTSDIVDNVVGFGGEFYELHEDGTLTMIMFG